MKNTFIAILMLGLTLPVFAQNTQNDQSSFDAGRWNFELRTGADRATQKLGAAKLKTGFGIDATFSYRFMPHLSVYAGWGWNVFGLDRSFAGTNMDFEETGYAFGLQFIHPFEHSSISYMVKAGGLYNHIETENSQGDIVNDSSHGLGWQAEAGVVVPLSTTVHLVPSVRYRTVSRSIAIGGVSTAVDLNYISIGAGIGWSL